MLDFVANYNYNVVNNGKEDSLSLRKAERSTLEKDERNSVSSPQ